MKTMRAKLAVMRAEANAAWREKYPEGRWRVTLDADGGGQLYRLITRPTSWSYKYDPASYREFRHSRPMTKGWQYYHYPTLAKALKAIPEAGLPCLT